MATDTSGALYGAVMWGGVCAAQPWWFVRNFLDRLLPAIHGARTSSLRLAVLSE